MGMCRPSKLHWLLIFPSLDSDTLFMLFKWTRAPQIFALLGTEIYFEWIGTPSKHAHIFDWWDAWRVEIPSTFVDGEGKKVYFVGDPVILGTNLSRTERIRWRYPYVLRARRLGLFWRLWSRHDSYWVRAVLICVPSSHVFPGRTSQGGSCGLYIVLRRIAWVSSRISGRRRYSRCIGGEPSFILFFVCLCSSSTWILTTEECKKIDISDGDFLVSNIRKTKYF